MDSILDDIAEDYDININVPDIIRKFAKLIKEIYKLTGQEVVILIDEYDKPILDVLDDKEKLKGNQEIIQNFYNVLKGVDDYIRFIFITGISKFAHTSIFSKLNNTVDISLSEEYSTICGIDHGELENYFKKHIENLADKLNFSYDECLAEINVWYDV